MILKHDILAAVKTKDSVAYIKVTTDLLDNLRGRTFTLLGYVDGQDDTLVISVAEHGRPDGPDHKEE